MSRSCSPPSTRHAWASSATGARAPERGSIRGLARSPGQSRTDRRVPRQAPARVKRMTHFWHPVSNMNAVRASGELVLDRGEGSHLWDDQGNRYIDSTAGLWFANVGY